MTDSNRTRMSAVVETTLGTTPTTPRMRKVRFTGESLAYEPQYGQSNDIRDDRMNSDPYKTNESNKGGVNTEFHFPDDGSTLSNFIASSFLSPWSNTPVRYNDGVTDSVITDIGTTANTVTFTTGAAFVVGHLVRMSGNANAANNGLFPVTTGGTTSFVSTGSGFVAETVPTAQSRAKVVGLQGTSGDLVAAVDGITSTTMNFTTMGLAVGQWIKIGGTGAGFRFANELCNVWARIVAIAANKLTLDNLPGTWTTDAGTGKTLRVFFGDRVKHGTTLIGTSIERSFLAQAVPSHILQAGMCANQATYTFTSESAVTAAFDFMGLTGAVNGAGVGSQYDDAPTGGALTSNASVGRVAEAGVTLSSPNWVKSATITINNNLRMKTAVGTVGAVDIGVGEAAVTVELNTYFGSSALLAKLLSGAATNVNLHGRKNSQACIWQVPRLTLTSGTPNAGGKNQDVMLPTKAMASADTLTNTVLLLDRLEFYQD
ncbi:phage tail tube protein [Paracraurococcus lichenis]|uniref:Phage tail tube protein n=1 Tax=Paracraurococcus lichenis TaxID=3064888 RepID=A0ABT9E935_9PROT|nr:phage tail tube protein [Paracraurococcus sp. LOR1-02]MDO9712455.1 phage tail tube protein [Paracraurococcus sp. LOR1-02]